jgi:uncharacterized protein (UPF0212 family)
MRRDKDKDNEEFEDVESTFVVCRSCGHRAPEEDFLKADSGDTRCPQCGEDDDLVFEM